MLVRRGMKYPEIVCNATKSVHPLRFVEVLLVNFSLLILSVRLVKYGIVGPLETRYNVTASGWFDKHTFEDWFKTVFLKATQRKCGTKVLIGDNIAFYCNKCVIQLFQENDIWLVFLIPNSTIFTQPLDVAVFCPVKIVWRSIL